MQQSEMQVGKPRHSEYLLRLSGLQKRNTQYFSSERTIKSQQKEPPMIISPASY
jgi:hypothetical protein